MRRCVCGHDVPDNAQFCPTRGVFVATGTTPQTPVPASPPPPADKIGRAVVHANSRAGCAGLLIAGAVIIGVMIGLTVITAILIYVLAG